MSNPKITVITPTYNRAQFIKATIESVLSQDYKDYEYLILDDGSTDNTRHIIEPYLKDVRVKYLYNNNIGEANTVNLGWKLAKGEYFIQINSDDLALPGLFTKLVKALDSNKAIGLAYCDFYIVNELGKIIDKVITADWDFPKLLSIYSCECATPGTMIRKSQFKSWKNLRDPEYKYIGDTVTYWKMALESDFLKVPGFLAAWRCHNESISSTRHLSAIEVEKWLKTYFVNKKLSSVVLLQKNLTRRNIYRYLARLFYKHKELSYRIKSIQYMLLATITDFQIRLIKLIRVSTYKPKVSIIIPVFNGENYLESAIKSALNQDYKNIEVIVVNDGSSDKTETIAKKYLGQIKYYQKINGGVASALNLGIKKSNGEYISWLSHDDLYLPNKISSQIKIINESRIYQNHIIFSDYKVIDSINNITFNANLNKDKLIDINNVETLKWLFLSGIHGCTLLIPKQAFYTISFFNESLKYTQDYDLWFKFVKNKFRFSYSNLQLVITRKHSAQGTMLGGAIKNKEERLLFKNASIMFKDVISSLREEMYYEFKKVLLMKHMLHNVVKKIDRQRFKKNGYSVYHITSIQNILRLLINYTHNEKLSELLESVSEDIPGDLIKEIFGDINFVNANVVLIDTLVDLNLNYLPLITRLKPTLLYINEGNMKELLNKEGSILDTITIFELLKKSKVAIVTDSSLVEKSLLKNNLKDKLISKIKYSPKAISQEIYKCYLREKIKLNNHNLNALRIIRYNTLKPIDNKNLDNLHKVFAGLAQRHQISVNERLLNQQLQKYAIQLTLFDDSDLSMAPMKSLFYDINKHGIKNFCLITIYKISKFVPKKNRRLIKKYIELVYNFLSNLITN